MDNDPYRPLDWRLPPNESNRFLFYALNVLFDQEPPEPASLIDASYSLYQGYDYPTNGHREYASSYSTGSENLNIKPA